MTLRDFKPDFNKNFNKIASLAEKLLEEWAGSSKAQRSQQALSYALDMIKPHILSLGLRITRLGSSLVEILVPVKARNIDEHGKILDGVLISSGIEAYQMLWKRNAPKGLFSIEIKNCHWKLLQRAQGEVRVRLEVNEVQREAVLAQLQKNHQADHQASLHFYNKENQVCAEMQIEATLHLKEMLEWK